MKSQELNYLSLLCYIILYIQVHARTQGWVRWGEVGGGVMVG